MTVETLGRVSTGDTFSGFFKALASVLALWVERYEQRRHLAEMDDRMLSDIGVSRGDARVEADKVFWLS